MNEYLFLIPIAIASIIGVISPGPSFLFVAQTAMEKSRAHGVATSLGMGVGSIAFALVASFGLFVVLETVPKLYIGLKFIGGLYLCYLAYKIWITANDSIISSTKISNKNSLRKSFYLGLLTQLSNPKTAIVFSGIFMAFLPSEIPNYSYIFLSLMAFVIDASWYITVSILLTTKKSQKLYTKFKKHINRVASGLMGFIGVKLALNQ
jgi:threonine/homoserine/homoserine lactone efflux protein